MPTPEHIAPALASSFPDYSGVAYVALAALVVCGAGVLLLFANLLRDWLWAQILGVVCGVVVCLCAGLLGWAFGFRMDPLAALLLAGFFCVGVAQILAVPIGRARRRARQR